MQVYYLERVSQVSYKKGPRSFYEYQSVLIRNIILIVRVFVVLVVLFLYCVDYISIIISRSSSYFILKLTKSE